MEVSSFRQPMIAGRLRSAKVLRLASDERLIALTRAGQERAFETLVERYRARLLAFCRHMLGSKEDAEDVLQEVFVAAYNALLADQRPINVRPWLYRIARNRCLNQLRRTTASGVDSMDVFLGDHGETVSERILQRERFRGLIEDIHQLPESQRTALLLRELDDLSYEQIAEAMETTVPSVKSLLVRARVGLAEASEARAISCEAVRIALGEEAEGLAKLSPVVRRHLRSCERCRAFRKQLRHNERLLAAVLPLGLLPAIQRFLIAHGSGASSSYLGPASAAGAAGAAGAGGSTLGSLASLGGGALATKAAAGIAAAAALAAGAVAAQQVTSSHRPAAHRARHHAPAASTFHVRPTGPAAPLAATTHPRRQSHHPAATGHGKASHGQRKRTAPRSTTTTTTADKGSTSTTTGATRTTTTTTSSGAPSTTKTAATKTTTTAHATQTHRTETVRGSSASRSASAHERAAPRRRRLGVRAKASGRPASGGGRSARA